MTYFQLLETGNTSRLLRQKSERVDMRRLLLAVLLLAPLWPRFTVQFAAVQHGLTQLVQLQGEQLPVGVARGDPVREEMRGQRLLLPCVSAKPSITSQNLPIAHSFQGREELP